MLLCFALELPSYDRRCERCERLRAGVQARLTRRSALVLPLALSSRAMATDSSKQPESFPYIQLWADGKGETHIKQFIMKGFDLKKYASVRLLFRAWHASLVLAVHHTIKYSVQAVRTRLTVERCLRRASSL